MKYLLCLLLIGCITDSPPKKKEKDIQVTCQGDFKEANGSSPIQTIYSDSCYIDKKPPKGP